MDAEEIAKSAALDRRHWWYRNASDEGSPTGALRIRLDRHDPQRVAAPSLQGLEHLAAGGDLATAEAAVAEVERTTARGRVVDAEGRKFRAALAARGYTLDDDGEIEGYERLERYIRGKTEGGGTRG